jgi:hypothetical protein
MEIKENTGHTTLQMLSGLDSSPSKELGDVEVSGNGRWDDITSMAERK